MNEACPQRYGVWGLGWMPPIERPGVKASHSSAHSSGLAGSFQRDPARFRADLPKRANCQKTSPAVKRRRRLMGWLAARPLARAKAGGGRSPLGERPMSSFTLPPFSPTQIQGRGREGSCSRFLLLSRAPRGSPGAWAAAAAAACTDRGTRASGLPKRTGIKRAGDPVAFMMVGVLLFSSTTRRQPPKLPFLFPFR